MQSYSVLPSVTEVSMEGLTASTPGRGRSDSRPATRETVLQYRANLNMKWSLPLRRSVGRNIFQMKRIYNDKIKLVAETQCCGLTLLPPTILCLVASRIRWYVRSLAACLLVAGNSNFRIPRSITGSRGTVQCVQNLTDGNCYNRRTHW
jgi:hypothetical protein